MRWIRFHDVILVLAIFSLTTSTLRAANVLVEMSSRETYVGVPIVLRLIVEDGEPEEPPAVPTVEGGTIRLSGGPARSSQTSIINGRVSQSISVSYQYQIVPQRPGRLTIPSFEVKAAGQTLKSQPQIIIVSKSETGDLLFVEVQSGRKSVYVGEPLEIALQIWLKPYQDRDFQFRFREEHMWGQIDLQASQWGVFAESLQRMFNQRQRPVGREVARKDNQGDEQVYYLYEVSTTLWPERVGPLDVGPLNIVVAYPTGLGRSRGVFDMGNLIITGTRPLSVPPQVSDIQVKPVPTEGRPAYFRGAVGNYEVIASAKPTEVSVGDPITLLLTITGSGRLEQLQPPPLPDLPELTCGFKVPPDPLAGEVQGNAKHFSQSIRAVSDDIREIPPIPFAYFDPQAGKFVTVRTAPIPIRVKPADKLAAGQVVDAAAGARPAARTLTEVSGGILANYTGMDEVLAQQTLRPGWVWGLFGGLPPLFFG
ncbi:MAG TPA: BatD family protein, partial [Phycisphaerae bacterium]|nr:BatD family protein [Phycisphaerae bacterium]